MKHYFITSPSTTLTTFSFIFSSPPLSYTSDCRLVIPRKRSVACTQKKNKHENDHIRMRKDIRFGSVAGNFLRSKIPPPLPEFSLILFVPYKACLSPLSSIHFFVRVNYLTFHLFRALSSLRVILLWYIFIFFVILLFSKKKKSYKLC